MSKNKFDKAFCIEIGEAITPYLARELYFDESSEYYKQKLNYKCNEKNCNAELYARCIYNEKRNKQVPHFAKKKSSEHDMNCYYSQDRYLANPKDPQATHLVGTKISRFPSVFLLNGFSRMIAGVPIVEDEIEVESNVTTSGKSSANTTGSKKSVSRTSLLDNLVDCYEKGNPKLLETEELTIDGKTKIFKRFFKNIKYYTDEAGLIYWGTVKELKKYGKNYRIIFEERPWVKGKSIQASIYLEDEVISSYRKCNSFRKQLDSLMNSKADIKCYFVGTYPKVVEVMTNEDPFEVASIHVNNLNHISFTFEEVQNDDSEE